MRPVISDGIVIPHVSIIRVRSILAVGAIIEDILRHLWRFIAGTGEEALGIVGDDERIAGQAGESWGLLRQAWQPFCAKNIPINQLGADEINIILVTTIVLAW